LTLGDCCLAEQIDFGQPLARLWRGARILSKLPSISSSVRLNLRSSLLILQQSVLWPLRETTGYEPFALHAPIQWAIYRGMIKNTRTSGCAPARIPHHIIHRVQCEPFIKRQRASHNQLWGLMWCKFGHVTFKNLRERYPRTPPSESANFAS
jgi:hypothetical protein